MTNMSREEWRTIVKANEVQLVPTQWALEKTDFGSCQKSWRKRLRKSGHLCEDSGQNVVIFVKRPVIIYLRLRHKNTNYRCIMKYYRPLPYTFSEEKNLTYIKRLKFSHFSSWGVCFFLCSLMAFFKKSTQKIHKYISNANHWVPFSFMAFSDRSWGELLLKQDLKSSTHELVRQR